MLEIGQRKRLWYFITQESLNATAMLRQNLLQLLHAYRASDVSQQQCRSRMIEFVQGHPDCFERSCVPDHVTGSAWLINPNASSVLLTYHKKLRKWLQLGGRVDGQQKYLQTAIREPQKESRIEKIFPVNENIFNAEIHLIPAHNIEPWQIHNVFNLASTRGQGLDSQK